MIFNYILSVGFVAIFVYLLYRLLKYIRSDGDEQAENDYETIEELKEAVMRDINEKTSINRSALEARIGKRDADTLEQNRRLQADAVRNCTNGSEGTRDTTKQLVRNFTARYIGQGKKAKERLRHLINFDNPSDRTMFEAICYVLGADDDTGFMHAFEMMHFDTPVITSESVRAVYNKTCLNLSDAQKQEILTQIVYADTLGLGVIDTLNYSKGIVEEIQVGVGGAPASSFSHRDYLSGRSRKYSYDSVRVMISGNVYRMPILGFGDDTEIWRVVTNLIKCSEGGELTAADPEKQVDAVDGRRINAMCSPAVSATCALIRKFDSYKYTDIKKAFEHVPGGKFMAAVLEMLVDTSRNIAISGEMATGKTSLLRSLMFLLNPKFSIRSVEDGAWELELRRYLPDEYSVIDFKISENFTEKQCFERIKQSSGNIGVVGEVKSPDMWNLLLNMTKFFKQTFWTTHETTTDRMIEEATNARLKMGYAGDRKAAEKEVVKSVNFDIRLDVDNNGWRYISEICEVISIDTISDDSSVYTGAELIYKGVSSITREMQTQTYKIVPLVRFNEDKQDYEILNEISDEARTGYKRRTGRICPTLDQIRSSIENVIDVAHSEGVTDKDERSLKLSALS